MKKIFFGIGIIIIIVAGICISDLIKILNSSKDDCCTCSCDDMYCETVCCTCANTIILPNMPR